MSAERKRFLLLGLLSAWALAWGCSFVAFAMTEPSGAGFTSGPNRISAFFGWQMAAALPAFAAWIVGRDWPRRSGVRFVSRIPIQLALGLAAVVSGLMLWARLTG